MSSIFLFFLAYGYCEEYLSHYADIEFWLSLIGALYENLDKDAGVSIFFQHD